MKAKDRRSLTDSFVLGLLKPPQGERERRIYDTKAPGLNVTVYASGTKSFCFGYSRGRPKWLFLGHAPPLKVNDARAIALEHGRKLLLDPRYDPVAERKLLRGAITFRDLKERYYADPVNQNKKSSNYTKRLIENNVVPKWGDMVADQITRSDARNLLSSFNRPMMKQHVKVLTGAIFNWGIKPEQELVKSNPFAGMRGDRAKSRERVVRDDEMQAVWRALDDLGLIRGSALKAVWLTGQRPGEVARMRREHLTADGWWLMPGKPDALGWRGTKNGRSHAVWLTADLMRLINEIDPDATTGFVFANRRGRPVRDIDTGMRELSAALGLADDPIRPHDLRRSFSTSMARLGYSDEQIDRILNHRAGEKNTTVRETYNRYRYETEDRAIMERVTDFLMRMITGGEATNVVAGSFGSPRE
jgi:integrase